MRHDGRRPDQLRPLRFDARLDQARRRLGAGRRRRHARAVHGERRGGRAGVPEGQGPRLDHRRVRDAAALDATRARGARPPRASSRDARRRSSAWSAASLRAVADLAALGERTDAHRLRRAAGGRRHALRVDHRRVRRARRRDRVCEAQGLVTGEPLRDHVAAVSVGIVGGAPLLDLDYAEDSACDTDMNVVMTGAGGFVELQGTAEGAPFSRARVRRAARAWRATASRRSSRRSARRCGADVERATDRRGSCSRRATKASCASSAACSRPTRSTSSRRRELGMAEADEPHATFVENALEKARHASRAREAAGARRRLGRLRARARRRAGRAQRALRGTSALGRAQQREADRDARGRRRPARALRLRARRRHASRRSASRSSPKAAGTAA